MTNLNTLSVLSDQSFLSLNQPSVVLVQVLPQLPLPMQSAAIERITLNYLNPSSQMESIQLKIPHYLPEITQLLDGVPRQLVLVLKTNDLLRGIEHSLGTGPQLTSYLTMAKSCLRALGEHQVATTHSWTTALYWRVRTKLSLLAVHTYELWIRMQHKLRTFYTTA